MRYLTPWRARLILLGLCVLVAVGMRGHHSIAPPPRTAAISDLELHYRTIARLESGEPYYAAVGDELRKNRYPTVPLINFRTPLHYRLVAALSMERAGRLLLGLGILVVVTGTLAYARQSHRKAAAALFFLTGAMLHPMVARPGGIVFAETWASLFIGLSLNAYVARRWVPGALLGVVAVFFRELAGAYALVCGLLALRERRWREFSVWVAGGLAYAVYFGVHAAYASAAVQPGDLMREHSYVRVLGIPFLLSTMYVYGWLALAPAIVTPFTAAFGLAAIWARSAPPQLTCSLVTYVILFCVAAQPFDFYWGYLTCAIWGHAFVHGAQGLRRLSVSATPQSARLQNSENV